MPGDVGGAGTASFKKKMSSKGRSIRNKLNRKNTGRKKRILKRAMRANMG